MNKSNSGLKQLKNSISLRFASNNWAITKYHGAPTGSSGFINKIKDNIMVGYWTLTTPTCMTNLKPKSAHETLKHWRHNA